MREHDGIIKIESLLVKSSDEREIHEVASAAVASDALVEVPIHDIFVDKFSSTPYNPRQISESSEL